MELTENVLEIRDLVKDFPGVRAVDNVSFNIKRNTIHCLVGENGAGKSTLIKILTGAYARTSGTTLLNGEEYNPHNPRDARQRGVSTLFQELNVVDQLTVEDNLTLGMEDTTFGFLRKTDKITKIINVMNSIEPPSTEAESFDPKRGTEANCGDRQGEPSSDSDVIIMDEQGDRHHELARKRRSHASNTTRADGRAFDTSAETR